MKIVTVEQMRAIEKQTDDAGISYERMMEAAGLGVAQVISDVIDVDGLSILILVGPGNNGGDGLVAGRYLAEAGARVTCYLYTARDQGDHNLLRANEMNLPILLADDDKEGAELRNLVLATDMIVDALLGTGVTLPIRGRLRTLFRHVSEALETNRQIRRDRGRASRGPVSPIELDWERDALPLVVAVDCPSGLDCDSGALDPVALPADLTVTFAAPKVGQVAFPGAAAVGDLFVVDIGCPADLAAMQEVALEMATSADVRALLPSRSPDAHKGTFGKVMIAAGSVNYVGAAALAAEAAYRAGGGLVTLAIPSAIHGPLATHLIEPTFVLLPHTMGAINEHAVDLLLESLDGYDALLIGPGLGRDEKTRLFLERLLAGKKRSSSSRGPIGFVREAEGPHKSEGDSLPSMVIDADALNLLSEIKDSTHCLPPECILTPHPGEMSRLTGRETGDIQADRIRVAQQAASEWGQVILLKGAFTVIASPDGKTTVIPFANPVLATAGTGDVLAGIIVSLLGQGLAPYSAAVAGAFLHGAAGEMAGHELGRAGTLAGDLLPYIAAVLESWQL